MDFRLRCLSVLFLIFGITPLNVKAEEIDFTTLNQIRTELQIGYIDLTDEELKKVLNSEYEPGVTFLEIVKATLKTIEFGEKCVKDNVDLSTEAGSFRDLAIKFYSKLALKAALEALRVPVIGTVLSLASNIADATLIVLRAKKIVTERLVRVYIKLRDLKDSDETVWGIHIEPDLPIEIQFNDEKKKAFHEYLKFCYIAWQAAKAADKEKEVIRHAILDKATKLSVIPTIKISPTTGLHNILFATHVCKFLWSG
jgi:hypothetical protein